MYFFNLKLLTICHIWCY